ncbi:Uncharacterized protein APZ42_017900 [Daphnia magna]|uniref:Uncharacterized protein n=1 Tax=Daphnia magna TaxID=35525 RepID=A0A0P5WX97_9CRUS|nr:Uncharacterized protein APZ42_017900 [Daphnia magna]
MYGYSHGGYDFGHLTTKSKKAKQREKERELSWMNLEDGYRCAKASVVFKKGKFCFRTFQPWKRKAKMRAFIAEPSGCQARMIESFRCSIDFRIAFTKQQLLATSQQLAKNH